jgi:hypothetical protein
VRQRGYFNEIFEATSRKYRDMGFPQKDADEKALKDALAVEIKNA